MLLFSYGKMVIAKQIFGIHLGHEDTHDLLYLVRYIGTASIVLSKMHHAREDLALLEPQR